MSSHNHSCTCDHEKVKFCKVCRVVHCLNCNQEWTIRSTTWYYPSGGTSFTTGLGVTSDFPGTSLPGTSPNPIQTTICQHSQG